FTKIELEKIAKRNTASGIEGTPILKTLPRLTSDQGELLAELKKALKNRTKGKTDAELTAASEKLRDYLFFLGLTAKDFKKAEKMPKEASSDVVAAPGVIKELITVLTKGKDKGDDNDSGGEEEDNTPSSLKAILRLYISSTQFLDCSSMVDWECLEKLPSLKPTTDFRTEKEDFATPLPAGESLDMDVYFTEAWDGSERAKVADRFAEKINSDSGKSLSLAMYGIDDIKGSMSNVYSAIMKRAKDKSSSVRAVVDVMGVERGEGPWVFNYLLGSLNPNKNVFSASKNAETPEGMHLTFQYDGTPSFLREMNAGIKNQEEARARIEWPFARIMHNKFAVLENDNGEMAVWTGTANISKNCMGLEANANMSVYIRNSHVAQAFLDQFNLMYNFDPAIPATNKLVTTSPEFGDALVGRFHRTKYPVNQRFFSFDDGTKLRVHFAPTDDAEHRVILPMLLSAEEGDEIRISMFGGTGYEIVRAMQYAAAKGANIKIAFDRRLGHGLTSWIRDSILNVNMENPYIGRIPNPPKNPGSIKYRVSTWTGKNHYKAGSLTRKMPDGTMRAEQMVVGSQNWSSSGNDFNDENMVSIQNLDSNVKSAVMFNKEFDTRLWVKSKDEKPIRNKPVFE
ncbi:MAG: hypothetical protein K2Q18_09230, partial [Bdellovibrionales bacterium]|nr:hypothetical protein [Bdellovibrionales bacterium]